MTDYRHLRELAEAATPGPYEAVVIGDRAGIDRPWHVTRLTHDSDDGLVFLPQDATYLAAAGPQTMIALLDELEHVKRRNAFEALRELDDLVEAIEQRDALQARIDAALAAIEGGLRDPIITPQDGYQYGFRNALHLVRAALTTPTENGEEQ